MSDSNSRPSKWVKKADPKLLRVVVTDSVNRGPVMRQ